MVKCVAAELYSERHIECALLLFCAVCVAFTLRIFSDEKVLLRS
jgi:hypothetical protein